MLQKKKRRVVICIWLLSICICQVQRNQLRDVFAVEYTEPVVSAKEIDLGDYQSQMVVGERQLLTITILPVDTTNQKIEFVSSDTSVAKINGMGRITALKAGVTEITVSCGGITEKFDLTVTDVRNVRDIDLGECPSEIEVGSSQILNVTIIPESSSGEKIYYSTNNENIATVNEIGRITGVKEGKVEVTITCGNISKTFSIVIVAAKNEVTDIEIADHEDELEVDKTMTLNTTIIPTNATDNTIVYRSSDENIATVNSNGEIKGISEGDVVIFVSSGKIEKQVKLRIKVATTRIEVNTTYLILRRGEVYQLTAKALPKEADQTIIYETVTPDIISVSGMGVVTAKECGTGEVIIKNKDVSIAVTVIVNMLGEEQPEEKEKEKQDNIGYQNEVYVQECQLVTRDMLKYYYTQNQNLTIYGNGYTMKIVGSEITNWENELYTNIDLKIDKRGITFELNRSKKISGPIIVQFDEDIYSGKYVYLYNTSKQRYEMLKGQSGDSMKLDQEGKYLITEKKLVNIKARLSVFIIVFIMGIVLTGIYIVKTKQYWFW